MIRRSDVALHIEKSFPELNFLGKSRLLNGSSKISSLGSTERALAMATLCCCPPLNI
jgi:hypothetical protein